jgi:hypothetical protein
MSHRPAAQLDGTPPSRPLLRALPEPPSLPTPLVETPYAPHPTADPHARARRLWGQLILKVGRPRPQEDSQC